MKDLAASKLKKNIGEKIKFYRKKLGLSQVKLSEIVNIEMKSLSRIESGHNYPQCENLIAIARALNISPWQLYVFDDDVNFEEMKKEIIKFMDSNNSIIPEIYQYTLMKALRH